MGDKFSISRRRLLQAGPLGGAMLLPRDAGRTGRRLGQTGANPRAGRFIPLTDCAPLAIAAAKGFDQKWHHHGGE
ncbi:hypothetical protein J4734_18795 [Klebsiella pneumoniae]|uniref:NrtA n=1 Tax=Klebsiella pneumoniae TaxID=573 RepID=A0A939SQ97_KLEPN|nr:hypothetical protein [Klebsiella pneumoniae]